MSRDLQLKTISDLEDRAIELTERFLRENGWEMSCQNALSLWFWEKTINGKHFTLTTPLALKMEVESNL